MISFLFVFLLLCSESVLCTFRITVHLEMCFTNILSQPVACFLFLDSVFCRTVVFNFDETRIIIASTPLVLSQKKSSWSQGYLDFLLCHLSKNFIVVHFTFTPVIHCELNFVKGIGNLCLRCSLLLLLLFWKIDVPFASAHLLKRLPFIYHTAFASLSKISWLNLYGSISELSIMFLWSVCVSVCQNHTVFIIVHLYEALKSSGISPLTLFIPSVFCLLLCIFWLSIQTLGSVCWYSQNQLLSSLR